jgi:hypothetical protein
MVRFQQISDKELKTTTKIEGMDVDVACETDFADDLYDLSDLLGSMIPRLPEVTRAICGLSSTRAGTLRRKQFCPATIGSIAAGIS